jgi:hypothetical protein
MAVLYTTPQQFCCTLVMLNETIGEQHTHSYTLYTDNVDITQSFILEVLQQRWVYLPASQCPSTAVLLKSVFLAPAIFLKILSLWEIEPRGGEFRPVVLHGPES